jgi:hypothetical protein
MGLLHFYTSAEACHPELVEGSCAEALPTMLRQAQHDTHILTVLINTLQHLNIQLNPLPDLIYINKFISSM